MNKICGYNCEHNKGGQCQITYCDKIGKITTTTQWLSGGRQQGKTYQLIKDQQKEIERLKNDKKKILELIENDYFEDGSFKNYDEVLNILTGGDEE